MRLISAAFVATAVLSVATPAQALTRQQLDCPAKAVSPDLAHRLSVLILDDNRKENELEQQTASIDVAAAQCMKQLKVPAAQQEAYYDYARLSAIRAGFVRRITTAGLRPALLDQTFDLGPGRGNPDITDLTDEQVERLLEALAKSGVKVEQVDEAIWPVVGGYLPLTSRVFQLEKQLNAPVPAAGGH